MGLPFHGSPSRRAVPTTPINLAGRHPRRHFRGLLGLHSCYGPPGRSTTQGGLCHEASIRPVTQPNRSSVPDLSTIIWVDSSSTGYPCLFGAHRLSRGKLPSPPMELLRANLTIADIRQSGGLSRCRTDTPPVVVE